MRKFAVTLMASLLSCSAALAFWPEATDSLLEVGVGYRSDTLEWKTSSHDSYSGSSGSSSSGGYFSDDVQFDGNTGRLSSHLKWKDLNIWQIEARGKYITCDNVYLRASADYGWVTSGKNTDRDSSNFNGYDFSGSEREFLRTHAKTKGHVYDVKLAVGYQFKLCDDSFSVVPLIGYSWNAQHLEDSHLRRSFSRNSVSAPSLPSVDSSARSQGSSDYFESFSSGSGYSSHSGNHAKYHARWNGPFIGFDFDYRFGCACEWDIFGTYEFHWADYHAKADWILRRELFNGFHHHAKNAYGSVFDIGVKWDFCECWTASIRGEFQWFWADHGRDRARIAEARFDGVKTQCDLSIPLKDIKWTSAAVIVDLGMVF